VFFFTFEIVDHGGHQGNTARVLAQWRHLVALHKATDALHRAMCTAPYRSGGMAIKIVVLLPSFLVILNSVVAHNDS
jgi:hypothetical protein